MTTDTMTIGLIGDFDETRFSHRATNDSIDHCARQLSTKVIVSWIPTPSLLTLEVQQSLWQFDGLWVAPGAPYLSQEGAHNGIRFAREHNCPFIGT